MSVVNIPMMREDSVELQIKLLMQVNFNNFHPFNFNIDTRRCKIWLTLSMNIILVCGICIIIRIAWSYWVSPLFDIDFPLLLWYILFLFGFILFNFIFPTTQTLHQFPFLFDFIWYNWKQFGMSTSLRKHK